MLMANAPHDTLLIACDSTGTKMNGVQCRPRSGQCSHKPTATWFPRVILLLSAVSRAKDFELRPVKMELRDNCSFEAVNSRRRAVARRHDSAKRESPASDLHTVMRHSLHRLYRRRFFIPRPWTQRPGS